MNNEMPRHKDRFILYLKRFVSFTSPIDPFVCTPKPFPFFGYCFATMFVCADTPASSPLLFPERIRDLAPLPQSTSDRINDYYHLIYALYAYRSLSQPLRCLISAGGQLSATLRRPYSRSNELAQRNTMWRIVANGHGSGTAQLLVFEAAVTPTSNPCSQSLDYFLVTPPDLSMRFGRFRLLILVSSVAWLVPAR